MQNQTFPEPNLMTTATSENLNAIRIDHAHAFDKRMNLFLKTLDIFNVHRKGEGFTIDIHSGYEVELANGNVPEGEIIPLSKVKKLPFKTKRMSAQKHRIATSWERAREFGLANAWDRAIAETANARFNEMADELIAFSTQASQVTTNLNLGTMQGALASAWGALNTVFENTDANVTPIVFANWTDISEALAKKELSLENQFGLNYYTDATGIYKVIPSSKVPIGNIYATIPDNLNLYYIDMNTAADREFGIYSAEGGYIGITQGTRIDNMTMEASLLSGLFMFPERVDGLVKVGIKTDATADLDKTAHESIGDVTPAAEAPEPGV